MDNDTHLHGGDLDDEEDDDDLELIFALFVLLGLALFDPYLNPPPRRRIREYALSGAEWVVELINGRRDRIFDHMRMEAPLFLHLCDLLQQGGYWRPHPTQRIGIHESVAIALVCLSHNERHRVLAERFNHSLETVDRHLRRCLRALVRLGRELVRQRNIHESHPRILGSGKYWPWFKDCIGAIDETHVSAWCTTEDRDRLRNRHGSLSQNVLAACDHDMRFVFVQVGWEDSTHDSRLLQNTLQDPNCAFPMPPEGKYYVVDAAHTNMLGFMAPFRGARGSHHERAAKALFNERHASLRSIIERSFGVLKKRFPILKGPMQNYLMATQNNIVLACCALHNFMRENQLNDEYFDEEAANGATEDSIQGGYQFPEPQPVDMSEEGIATFAQDRIAIANSMYRHRH